MLALLLLPQVNKKDNIAMPEGFMLTVALPEHFNI